MCWSMSSKIPQNHSWTSLNFFLLQASWWWDADQSIYSLRGAHVESMSDFLYEFDNGLDGVHTVYLMENYR
jgi:hypothetical protein